MDHLSFEQASTRIQTRSTLANFSVIGNLDTEPAVRTRAHNQFGKTGIATGSIADYVVA